MWFKFNSEDYLVACRGLNATEQGIYISLIVAAMSNGGRARPVTLTRAQMLQLSGGTKRDLPALLKVLDTRFHLGPEGYELIRDAEFLSATEPPIADKRNATKIERIKLVLEKNKKAGPRLSGDLSGSPKVMQQREYKRQYRDQLAALKNTAELVGLDIPEGAKVRDISALLVAKLGELEATEEAYRKLSPGAILERREMEEADNARSLREMEEMEAKENGQNVSEIVVQPVTDLILKTKSVRNRKETDKMCPSLQTEKTGFVRDSDRGGGDYRGGGSNTKEKVFSISSYDGDMSVVSENPRPARPLPPPQAGATGSATKAMRLAGIADCNPSHPQLVSLVAQGVTPGEFGDAAAEAVARGKGRFAYVLAVVESRRREAAAARPLPGKAVMPSGETVDDLDRRIFGEDGFS